MACSCRTAKIGVLAVARSLPHEVLPDESCIFCAGKHVDTAYSEMLSGGSRGLVIGELELARRHTVLEYEGIADSIAWAEFLVCMRSEACMKPLLACMDMVHEEMSRHDGSDSVAGKRLKEAAALAEQNPLIGEVHVCAAWRLASEVGYMLKNRAMIIGDLAMAGERFARLEPSITLNLRELRHRVQTARAADLDIYWPYVVNGCVKFVNSGMGEFGALYARGLAERLGVLTRFTEAGNELKRSPVAEVGI